MKNLEKFYICYANLACEITAPSKWKKYLKKLYSKSTILNFSDEKPLVSSIAKLKIQERELDNPECKFITHKDDLLLFEIQTSQHTLFLFPLIHQLVARIFNILFHLNGGFVLHASSILINDQVFIFAGKPGRGKSTIVDFLKNEFPTSKILSDNSAFIINKSKSFILFPSPYIEANRIDLFQQSYQNKKPFEINSIYFPFHANNNAIIPLGFDEKIALIQENSLIPYDSDILFAKDQKKTFAKTIFSFASSQKINRLDFTKNKLFIKLLPLNI